VTTASEISAARDGRVTSDVLLLGAAGNSGRLIAAELAARGLSIRLAGRRRGPLEDLARALAADGATTDVRTVDVSDPAPLTEAIVGVGVVLSTIGPFARQAGPVIDACLATKLPYVDIANEWPAVRGLLDRDEEARAHAVTLVTGAGFGPAATETLVLRLVEQTGGVPDLVRVAAAAGVTQQSDGVRQTIQASLAHGVAVTYRHDLAVQETLGTEFGCTGSRRRASAAWAGHARPAGGASAGIGRRAAMVVNLSAFFSQVTTSPIEAVRAPPHPVSRFPAHALSVDRMWHDPNRIPAAQGPIVAVSPVRRQMNRATVRDFRGWRVRSWRTRFAPVPAAPRHPGCLRRGRDRGLPPRVGVR
jgi:hypothetical protein